MKYINEDNYNGEWKNNKREGVGILKCNDGIIYEGNWVNDKKEGLGNILNILKIKKI